MQKCRHAVSVSQPVIFSDNIIVFLDGAAKGNPGPAGIGVIFVRKSGTILREISHFIGLKTNNQAEYEALLAALENAKDFTLHNITLRTDSELIFQQIQGKYKVRNDRLKKYHSRAIKMMSVMPKAKLELIPRAANRQADRLANQAIKRYLKAQFSKE